MCTYVCVCLCVYNSIQYKPLSSVGIKRRPTCPSFVKEPYVYGVKTPALINKNRSVSYFRSSLNRWQNIVFYLLRNISFIQFSDFGFLGKVSRLKTFAQVLGKEFCNGEIFTCDVF